MAVDESPLRAWSPTAGFAPFNRRRQQGAVSRPAKRTQDVLKRGKTRVSEMQLMASSTDMESSSG